MKKLKKLQLNKEIISSLQEKQMKSFIGGNDIATWNTITSAYTCGSDCGLGPTIVNCEIMPQHAAQINSAASCCRKSCN